MTRSSKGLVSGEPAEEVVEFPASVGQERLLFLDYLEPGTPAYNVPAVVRLQGTIRLRALETAMRLVVDRHEALRTIFDLEGANPVQVVAPRVDVSLLVVEASAPNVQRLLAAELARSFDLTRGPLFRCSLFRSAPEDHVLCVTFHHLICDAWSLSIIVQELTDAVSATLAGRPWLVRSIELDYGDFSEWQREWLGSPAARKQLESWRTQLERIPALDLPTDRSRPSVRTSRGEVLRFRIPVSTAGALRAWSTRAGGTLFMVLVAVLRILLFRYTGHMRIGIGTPVSGRTRPEMEPIVGFFVNTVVLTRDVAGAQSAEEYLQHERQLILEALSRQDYPFERLVEIVNPPRDLSRTPFFDVMCALANVPRAPMQIPGISLRPVEPPRTSAKFDLTFELAERGSEIEVTLEYSTDLFDRTTVARIAGHYLALLGGAASTPGRAVSSLELLTVGEAHQLLVEWNNTAAPVEPADLATLFRVQVERTPEAVAVWCDQQAVTYRELGARARRIAARLREMGAGPDTLVAICARRTPDMIAGLLGVLEAGAAYAPLDPAYPQDRLSFMLADTEAPILLVDTVTIAVTTGFAGVRILLEDVPPAQDEAPGVRAGGSSAAYLIYTSGSTGRPKAIVIEQANVVTFLSWGRQAFPPELTTVTLASSSICFDLSVFEVFLPLISGGRVVLVANALAFATAPERHQVTLLNTVPSALNTLERLDAIPASVSTVCTAGEVLRGALVRAVRRRPTVHHFIDLYGPAEDATYSTCSWLEATLDGEPTLGLPIANTRAWIVDGDLHLLPAGVAGEACLAGAQLSRGYLNRPMPSAERFVPEPFGSSGGRMYRTGDLVKRFSGGPLALVGRIDHQVKVRGFRIELGEVEVALRREPAIRDAVVVAFDDADGKQLTAYFEATAEIPVGALRSALSAVLPGYMVPTEFVQLPELPRNANGKIDRKRLPAPVRSGPAREHARPATELEREVARLIAEVLGKDEDRIALGDDFFEIGGHSLRAVQLMIRVREQLSADLPLAAIFEERTVERLSQRIADAWAASVDPETLRALAAEASASPDSEAPGNGEKSG